MISHEHKFIFIHIPKCGGTSVECAFNAWDDKDNFFVGSRKQHWFLDQIIKANPESKDYASFAFIRNPFSRIVSEYKYAKKESHNNCDHIKSDSPLNLSFKEFCKDLEYNLDQYCYHFHEKSLCDYLLNANGSEKVNYIGRLENFQKDFNAICDKMEIPQKRLPHVFKSDDKKNYTEYYDDETRAIIAEKYAKDIDYFGYKFGE
jgi:hypothetical protein